MEKYGDFVKITELNEIDIKTFNDDVDTYITGIKRTKPITLSMKIEGFEKEIKIALEKLGKIMSFSEAELNKFADNLVKVKKKEREIKTDGCQVCFGARGGVPGKENLIDGLLRCDSCHADYRRHALG
jgi:hypothetical protein